jgi:hypothetical protein
MLPTKKWRLLTIAVLAFGWALLGCKNPTAGGPTEQALAPTFNPAPGAYSTAQSVVISTSNEGASIRYTTDGSTPSATYGEEYSGIPLQVTFTTMIKAIAYSDDYLPSDVSEGTYTIPGKVATPYVTPLAGTYTVAQTVAIATATAGAEIYYTLDGTVPNASDGTPYSGAILIDKTTTIRAIAYKAGEVESNVMTATFTIGVKVATPTFSIVAGTYAQSQSVVVSTTTAGATIRYTTNGVNPTQTYGTVYTGPITVSKTQTLKAIACAAGKLDSNIATAAYVIALDSNNAGDSTAVATDGTNVYIAYYSSAGDDLFFIRSSNGGTSWDAPIAIDRIGTVGLYISMFRKNNSLYISYYDDTNDDLKVAVSINGGDTWSVYRADSAGNVGQHTGIYVDDSNAIHVAYYDVTNLALKYAKSTDGGNTWAVQTVENAANPTDFGKYACITGDGGSNLYLAYYDANSANLNLRFTTSVDGGTNWAADVDLDTTNDVGQYAKIARDSLGNLYILYQDATSYNLKMAKYIAGWAYSTVLSAGDVGSHIGFCIDSNNYLNVVYYNDTQFRNEFIQSIDGGSTWSTPVVIDDGGVGQNASLAVSGITLWASYYDAVNADLKAAKSTDAGVSWTIY